jgi:CubicO group peptidase (beta-lactamase class C family)
MEMKDTHFYLEPKDAPRFTTYYQPDGKGNMSIIDPGSVKSRLISGHKTFYSGSGGLNSTAMDYFKFCQMVIQNGEYNGVRIAKPSTIALMKTDQLPLNLGVSFSQEDEQKNYGFTFGYGIKRREVMDDPVPIGTISWGGATGPTFFIDLKHEMIAMVMFQTPMTFPVEIRNNFSNWMMKSIIK